MTTVTIQGGTRPVVVRGGGTTVVTLDRDTVAKIQGGARGTTVKTPTARATVTTGEQRVVEVGQMGVQGPPGQSGDTNFEFTQSTPSASWLVTHNLGKHPAVDVVDSAGTSVVGVVTHLSTKALRIDFAAPFAGTAYLN
ncbi:MAG TPA: hypothetical protein VFG73_02200 [Rhodanobacteraceae bacterium]|nr:hypothetical protein [Rhodanobacteraceae bacterium]